MGAVKVRVEMPRETFGVCGASPKRDWLADGLCQLCWDKSGDPIVIRGHRRPCRSVIEPIGSAPCVSERVERQLRLF